MDDEDVSIIICLDTEKFDEFEKALDAHPKDLPRLKELISKPSILEDYCDQDKHG